MPRYLSRIVSGGQTGVDRGALRAALDRGVPCGGWCPEGRKAEDGRIPDFYPMTPLAGGDYVARTLRNVVDSDGTLIIYFSELEGGTKLTRDICRREGKRVLALDAIETDADDAADRIVEFVNAYRIETLNVAGPRGSRQPAAAAWTRLVLRDALSKL